MVIHEYEFDVVVSSRLFEKSLLTFVLYIYKYIYDCVCVCILLENKYVHFIYITDFVLF